MKYEVLSIFRDRYNKNIIYRPGGTFETTDEKRVKNLQKRGLIGAEIIEKQPENPKNEVKDDEIKAPEQEGTLSVEANEKAGEVSSETVHVVQQKPGGWYELSDGRTVRKSEIPGGD